MKGSIYSIITGSGSYIPPKIVENKKFHDHVFYNTAGELIPKTNEEIVRKFQEITEIEERRYADDQYLASDLAYFAAQKAVHDAQIDPETLDYIIVAHNFGDVRADNLKCDTVPSLASRVKLKLGIENPFTVAYDLPFGCPGWVQGVIQADYYLKSGDAKRILVIGAEILSRIADPHDIDSMIYSDGAGAVILEAATSEEPVGVISHLTRTDAVDYAFLLRMGKSYNPNYHDNTIFVKMNGRKLYEYALNTVPGTVKACIDKAGLDISDIKKVLIHQANAKMDDAILSRLFRLYGIKDMPEGIMPMTISKFGNNSVATVPILYDLIMKGGMENQQLNEGDFVVFTSVGAGMNVNAFIYRMP